MRRECQPSACRSGSNVIPLRKNINTFLSKLDEVDYNAIILATISLERLWFINRIKFKLILNSNPTCHRSSCNGIEIRINNESKLSDPRRLFARKYGWLSAYKGPLTGVF